MATNRKSTLKKVGTAVKKAARTVGKALGLKTKKTPAKSSAAKKTGMAKTTKAGATKKAVKKTTAGSTRKGAARGAGRGR